MTKSTLEKPEDIEKIRAEYDPVLGRDPWPVVLFYVFMKLCIKFFSLSGLFAIVATGMILDIAEIGSESKGNDALNSWYPWAFVTIAWLNWAARPQFKKLSAAVAVYLRTKNS